MLLDLRRRKPGLAVFLRDAAGDRGFDLQRAGFASLFGDFVLRDVVLGLRALAVVDERTSWHSCASAFFNEHLAHSRLPLSTSSAAIAGAETNASTATATATRIIVFIESSRQSALYLSDRMSVTETSEVVKPS